MSKAVRMNLTQHQRSLGLAATVLAMAAMVAACGLLSEKHTYRYRLTVEVLTPQGLRSGSSVLESTASESSGLNGSMVHSELRGEAVSIDLPNGGTLFAVLKGVDNLSGAYASAAYSQRFPDSVNKNIDWRVPDDAIASQTTSADVPVDHYPIFVRFANIKDPSSVVAVDPAHLDDSFGPGVRLSRVYVQTTIDPVTSGIEKRLPWLMSVVSLTDHSGGYMDETHPERNLARRDFIRKG